MDSFGTWQQLEQICNNYQKYINTWYISPPFNYSYASRKGVLAIPTSKNINEIQSQLTIIKQYNQLIQLALNSLPLKKMDSSIILNDFQMWNILFHQPDSIVLLDELIPSFLNFNIPLTYSYNNNYSQTKLKNLKFCNTIVLGNRNLRNINFMYKIKEKYNIKIELLLNNGCHFLCQNNCSICIPLQNKRLTQINKYQALAEQSLLPSELKLFPNNLIDLYKISSRPCSFLHLDNVLHCYINQPNFQELNMALNLTHINNWNLFCRLQPILDQFKNDEEINIDQVLEYKYQIWKNILGTTNINF